MPQACDEFCPVAESCLGRYDAANGQRQAAHDELQEFYAHEHRAQLDDLIEGFAILSGQLTADEAEQRQRQREASDATDFTGQRQRLRRALAVTDAQLAQATGAIFALSEAKSTCPGPHLSLLGKLAMTAAVLRSGQKPDEPSHAPLLNRFGRCSSAAAKAALRSTDDAVLP